MIEDYSSLGNLNQAEANFQVVREAYRRLDVGDAEGFYAVFSDNTICYDAESLPYGGEYRGKGSIRVIAEKMFSAWQDVRWKLLELSGGGDVVVVHLCLTFTPHGGEPFDHLILELWRFSDGKVCELRPFYYDTKLIADTLAGR